MQRTFTFPMKIQEESKCRKNLPYLNELLRFWAKEPIKTHFLILTFNFDITSPFDFT